MVDSWKDLAGSLERLGLLSGVGMFIAFIDFELGHQDAPKAILWDHSANGVRDELFGVARTNLRNSGVFFAAFPA